MGIKEAEKTLFNEWKKENNDISFIPDGVFDEEEYMNQKCKILFVLKEANWEGGNEDLCKYLLSEESPTYWKTWNNIARWSKAILEGGDYQEKVSRSDKSLWLRKVAFMNLKKVGGNERADNATIYNYAERDKAFIKRQIEIYEPDIIICCGRGKGKNADILHDIVFSKDEVSEWKEPVLMYNYFVVKIKDKNNIPVVSFYHPQIIGSHELFKKRYEEMKIIAKQLIK